LSIEIRNLSVRSIADDSAALALYEEWHIEGRQTEGRLCSATLMLDGRLPGGVQWVRIHESSLVNQMDGDR
jgi:hypothetical protein